MATNFERIAAGTPASLHAMADYYLQAGRAVVAVRPDLNPMVAERLGIDATRDLTRDEMAGLLSGHRADGQRIEGKTYVKPHRLSEDRPRARQGRIWSTPTGSIDFTFTPAKSVSVAYALLASDDERVSIFLAHQDASREASAYIAGIIGQARLGHAGLGGREPGHLNWIEVAHGTTRPIGAGPPDPNLHTHIVFAPNAVFCESGRVGSVIGHAFDRFLTGTEDVYQTHLGDNLHRSGFRVHRDERTAATFMSDVPPELSSMFSKRSQQGEVLARERSREAGEVWDGLTDWQRSKRIDWAIQATRQRKDSKWDGQKDVENWRQQAQAAGWDIAERPSHDYSYPISR